MKRTYVDSCVLIAAFRGTDDISARAMAIIDDAERSFVVSPYLTLEVLPKPTFHQKNEEVAFMRDFLQAASEHIAPNQGLANQAIEFASRYDLSVVDALHISAATQANVDEFVTAENSTKPLFRVQELQMSSIRD